MTRLTVSAARRELKRIAESHEGCLYGECAVFALALQRVSGLPLFGLAGYSEELDKEVLVHAYVGVPVTVAGDRVDHFDRSVRIDIKGPRSLQSVFDDFTHDDAVNVDEVQLTQAAVSRLATGRSRCPSLRSVLPLAERVWALSKIILEGKTR